MGAGPYRINKLCCTDDGHCYSGPSCERAGIPLGKKYADLNEAVEHTHRLIEANPVGWTIIDCVTGERVWYCWPWDKDEEPT